MKRSLDRHTGSGDCAGLIKWATDSNIIAPQGLVSDHISRDSMLPPILLCQDALLLEIGGLGPRSCRVSPVGRAGEDWAGTGIMLHVTRGQDWGGLGWHGNHVACHPWAGLGRSPVGTGYGQLALTLPRGACHGDHGYR